MKKRQQELKTENESMHASFLYLHSPEMRSREWHDSEGLGLQSLSKATRTIFHTPDLHTLLLKLSSQATIDCVKLIIKTIHYKLNKKLYGLLNNATENFQSLLLTKIQKADKQIKKQ